MSYADYDAFLDSIKTLENDQRELKESFSDWDAIGKTFAAFSTEKKGTEKGGTVFVGVKKDGTPVGVRLGGDFKDKLMVLARTINPPATISINQVIHDAKRELYLVRIDVGQGRGVYSYKNVSYQRRGGINHPLIPDEIVDIQKNRGNLSFDEQEARCDERPGLITDIDETKVGKFLIRFPKKYSSEIQTSIRQFLLNESLCCQDENRVKNAAILLFGKDVDQFIPQNKIVIIQYPSDEVTNIFEKTVLTGDIVSLSERAFFEVDKRLKTFSSVEGFNRVDIPEYPPEAIREVLINAIVHRDYFEKLEVFVKIFKNRIEILNPGGFPFKGYEWNVVEERGLTLRRNEILANFFERYQLMEKAGQGIPRMKRALVDHGLHPPKIEVSDKIFKITFFNAGEDFKSLMKSPYNKVIRSEDLSERQQFILSYLTKEAIGVITAKEYARLTKVTHRTAWKDLGDLCKKGFFEKSGNKRYAKYMFSFKK